MNKRLSILALTVSFSAAAYAAPFLAVGDGAELFLTGSLGVRADDNIYLTKNETDDMIIDIKPGAELIFGKNSATQGHLRYVESISRYSDNDNLDTSLSSLSFLSKFDDGKSKLNANASFDQLNQNTFDTRNFTRRDVSAAGLSGEVSVTEKSSVGAGGAYSRTDYKRAGYSDLTTFTVPVNYYYELSPKLDLSLGFRFRDTDSQLGRDSKDYAYRVGVRGEFTPKVVGNLQVGFGNREYSGGGDENMLDVEGDVTFTFSEKTLLQVTVSNDFGNAAQGQEQKSFSLGGNLLNRISEVWTIRSGLNYRKLDYYTREDDYVEAQLGADYTINSNVSISLAYAYRNYDTVLTASEFTNNVFSVAANLRY